MKIGKYNNDEFLTIDCENGKEVNGDRTLEELYALGYKDVCEVAQPSETATCTYDDYSTCFVQVWHEQEEPTSEIADTEALQIITEGE